MKRFFSTLKQSIAASTVEFKVGYDGPFRFIKMSRDSGQTYSNINSTEDLLRLLGAKPSAQLSAEEAIKNAMCPKSYSNYLLLQRSNYPKMLLGAEYTHQLMGTIRIVFDTKKINDHMQTQSSETTSTNTNSGPK